MFFINCEMGEKYFFWTVSIMYWMGKLWLVKPHKIILYPSFILGNVVKIRKYYHVLN